MKNPGEKTKDIPRETNGTGEVARLLAENAALREQAARLETENNSYRKAILGLLKQNIKKEDFQDLRLEDFTISAAEFLEELGQAEAP